MNPCRRTIPGMRRTFVLFTWVLAGFAIFPLAAVAAAPAYTVVLLPDGQEVIISDFEEAQALLIFDERSMGPAAGQQCLDARLYWNNAIWPSKVAAEGIGVLAKNAASSQPARICPASSTQPAIFGVGTIDSLTPDYSYHVLLPQGLAVLRMNGIPGTKDELFALESSGGTSAARLSLAMLGFGALVSLLVLSSSRLRVPGWPPAS